MINHNKDINLIWKSSRDMYPFLAFDKAWEEYPRFNVIIYNAENDEELEAFYNIKSPDNARIEAKKDIDALRDFLGSNSYAIYANQRTRAKFTNTMAEYNAFNFTMEQNIDLYLRKNNKFGYYKKLKFYIYFIDDADSQIANIEYPTLNIPENIEDIFEKIYRSTDNYSIKFKINSNLFLNSEIKSFWINPIAVYNENEFLLNNIFASDIEGKWLSTVDNTKLLTLPLSETAIVEEAQLLKIKITYLNNHQTEVIKFMKDKLSLEEVDTYINDNFISQSINYTLQKESSASPSANVVDNSLDIKEIKDQLNILMEEIKKLKK